MTSRPPMARRDWQFQYEHMNYEALGRIESLLKTSVWQPHDIEERLKFIQDQMALKEPLGEKESA